ncbi:MAG TPA: hypothetical protein VNT60_10625 [Deinococcales bacterium]|nr:hypothetical protein [Deinococcales bacterium]
MLRLLGMPADDAIGLVWSVECDPACHVYQCFAGDGSYWKVVRAGERYAIRQARSAVPSASAQRDRSESAAPQIGG